MTMSRSKKKDASAAFGARLMRAGCALMALVPLLFAIGVGAVAWPALVQLLPRGVRPVPAAQSGEVLMVVATLQNDPGSSLTNTLDGELVDLSRQYYLYNARIERLNEAPTTRAEARALAGEYNAAFLVWGDASQPTVNVEVLTPLDFTEPLTLTFEPEGELDSRTTDVLAQTMMAVLSLHNRDTFTADTLLRNLPTNLETFGVAESTYLYYLAKIQLANANYTAAADMVQQALEDYPDDVYLLALYAQTARSQDEITEAITAMTRLIDTLEDSERRVQALHLRADLYIRGQQLAEAEADLQTALQTAPDDLLTLTQLYDIQFSTGEYEAALATINRLVEAQAGTPIDAYLSRAEVLDRLDRQDDALETYATALALADTNATRMEVLTARGYALLAADEAEAARADFRQVQSFSGAPASALVGLGLSYWVTGDVSTARDIWEDNFGVTPTAALGYPENNLAWELALQGYPEPGLFYSDLSLSVEPLNPNFLHTHGYINLLLGNYQQAIVDFDDALDNNLQYYPVYRDLGDAFFGLEQWEDAILYYEDYLRLTPNTADDIIDVIQHITLARAELENP